LKRLSDLEPAEVSLVPKGANKRKFLVLKSEKMTKEELLKVLNCEPSVMKNIEKVIRKYSVPPMDEDGIEKDLTTEGRKHIAAHNFAIPEERKYPIHDLAHARNALARVEQHGTPEEKAKVHAAVKRKFPALAERSAAIKAEPEQPGQGIEPEGEVNLDDRAQSALKAVVRILTPWKGKLSPLLIHEILDAAGFQLTSEQPTDEGDAMRKEASATQSPEPIEDEHHIEAMKVAKAAAKKAYGEHLAKLGYQKYPTEEVAQKDLEEHVPGHVDDDEEQEEEQEGTMHSPADARKEGSMHRKEAMHAKKEGVMKSLMAKVPKDVRPVVEAIYKSSVESVRKAHDLEREVTALKRAATRKEIVAKAASLSKLGLESESVVDTLMGLHEAAPELAEKVEKMLGAANEQVSKGALFQEFGSSQPADERSGWAKIEKAATEHVAKSGLKMSTAQAVDAYLQTDAGKRDYAQYSIEHEALARRGA